MNISLAYKWYESPIYLAKLREKLKVLEDMDGDQFVRASKIMDEYAVDPAKFIEHFLLIQFKELNSEIKPFFLFQYQRELIMEIQKMEAGMGEFEYLVDKPRGMGITWVLAAYFLWRWLYTPNYSVFILSRTETEVDDGQFIDPNSSIFSKIRWMLARVPKYMIPEGFQPKKTKGTPTDSTLMMLNPAMGSSIIGSSTNSNAGRSRRYTTVFVDECFSIDRFQELYRSLQSVARVKLFVSTVKPGRVFEDFKKMCEEKGHYFSLKWEDHPWKDQEWFDEQIKKAEFDPMIMKEVQADYAIDPRSAYYPEIKLSKIEEVIYDRNKPVYVSLDFGVQDLTVLLWWQFDGSYFKLVEAYWNKQKPVEWYAPFMNPEISYNPEHYSPFQRKFLDMIRGWKKPVAYFGASDHLRKVMPLNRSIADELNKYGIRIIFNPDAVHHDARRNATTRILPRTVFNGKSDGAMRVYDAIAQSRYSNIARSTTDQKKPVHDIEIADMREAFENGAVNFPRVFSHQRGDISTETRDFARGIMQALKRK